MASKPIVRPALAYVSHVSRPLPINRQTADSVLLTPTGTVGLIGFTSGWARGTRVPIPVYVLARNLAATDGDLHPRVVQWVKTRRQIAVASQSSDRVDSPGRKVYFVVVHGHFVDKNAYYLGAARNAPAGSVLSFTIDLRSGQILDFALGNKSPDYSKTGRPHRFSFAKARGKK